MGMLESDHNSHQPLYSPLEEAKVPIQGQETGHIVFVEGAAFKFKFLNSQQSSAGWIIWGMEALCRLEQRQDIPGK